MTEGFPDRGVAPTGEPPLLVVMGVSGTGKSTVGALLARELAVPYAEADDFHPPANIARMAAGTPLTDEDREPWLAAIGDWLRGRRGRGGVVSCSALRRRYRDVLRTAAPGVRFVHLRGERALIDRRLAGRLDHFMPRALLDSQFATLEPLEPDEAGTVLEVSAGPATLTRRALRALGLPADPESPGRRPPGDAPDR
ncbi:gluconokinase [Streptomyces sp. NPDC005438]|uniref:gluconokinase n=1 Tax=Streptomyces sp. NPDC005438 TaxID=3156880 RepID=UPI0033AA1493